MKNNFNTYITADACRDSGFMFDGNGGLETLELPSETESSECFYFKTIGISDKNGYPYLIFSTTNKNLVIPRTFIVSDNGEEYEIVSDLDKSYQKLPYLEEGVDFKIKLKDSNLNIKSVKSILRKGTFKIEWDNMDYSIDVSRLNFIIIGKNG